MCAERGPTSRSAARLRPFGSSRSRLPPAIASVRTSSVRSIVRWPPTRAGRICGRPCRITEQSALVPPTSMKMPSVTFSCRSAPATPAAGPESIVRIGRRATSRTSMTPPSLRMIMSGTPMPALRAASAVISLVRSMRGKIAALSSAVRVRARRPYIEETSWPEVASKPRARAASTACRLARGTVDAERIARGDRFDALRRQPIERAADRRPRFPLARRRPARPKPHSAPSASGGTTQLAARDPRKAVVERERSDLRDVAFEQCVRRLRRRVREKRDACCSRRPASREAAADPRRFRRQHRRRQRASSEP